MKHPSDATATKLDRYGRDPLHYAAGDGDVDAVRARLAAGVEVDLRERRGRFTPLHFAVQEGAVDTAEALLDAGADINAEADAVASPLHLAVSRWHLSPDGAVIKLLIQRGADRTIEDEMLGTAAEMAAAQFEFPPALLEILNA
ncbi:ankyrin repeat domain-containing protein [Sciscionella marina]|uniref:ankyrin repeat domain-containing protein n=1 Tax=Sciscionella marina TaxID=508770 RepID=UPI00037199BF|nr:ankyrin repeat domain-containing protein [Sciscionella marina]